MKYPISAFSYMENKKEENKIDLISDKMVSTSVHDDIYYDVLCKVIISHFKHLKNIEIIDYKSTRRHTFSSKKRDGVAVGRIDKDILDVSVNIVPKKNVESLTSMASLISANVPITNDSLTVMIILHEIGHFDFVYALRYKYNHNRLVDSLYISDISRMNLEMVFGEEDENLYGLRTDEGYADRFMYMNFPGVWNMLLNSGVIGGDVYENIY